MSAPPVEAEREGSEVADTSLLSKHGALLLELERRPDPRVAELARRLRVSTRTVRRLISELEANGVLARHRVGNRNRYVLNDRACPDAALRSLTVEQFLKRLSA